MSQLEATLVHNPLSESDLRAEFERCKKDYNYFRKTYLPVVDRDTSKTVRFALRRAQRVALRTFIKNGSSMVLKFRRAGVSRAIMSYILWKVMFNANLCAISVLHTGPEAIAMFTQVRDWCNGLPAWMKQGPFKLKSDRKDEIVFEHGGVYRVVSADSKPAGGPTWWYRHYSEFAKYADPEGIIRIIENGSAAHGRAIYETTAEGVGHAFTTWRGENGWGKVFLPWTLDGQYALTAEKAIAEGVKNPADLIWPEVANYAMKYGLTEDQARWVGARLRSNNYSEGNSAAVWRGFHQEMPITADLAFTTAKGRVFTAHYPMAKPKRGYEEYEAPLPYGLYVLGSDAAGGGEDGDYQAFEVQEVSDPEKPRIVASFYDKIENSVFASKVHEALKRYTALFIGERDAWGRDVISRLVELGWSLFWVEVFKDSTTGKPSERLGRTPGPSANAELVALSQEFLNGGKLDPSVNQRLCHEMNDFLWAEGTKAEAGAGNHDDMVRADGLCLVGRQQIQRVEEVQLRKRPITLQERVAFQSQTGHTAGVGDHFETDWYEELFGGAGGGMASTFDLIQRG